jgi:hypothetical protein
MSKKSLNVIITALGVALDSDCRAMNDMSNDKLDRLLTIYEELVEAVDKPKLSKLPQPGSAEYEIVLADLMDSN